MTNPVSPEELEQSIQTLFANVASVQLATLDPQGDAEISYTPYLLYQERIYVLISELADHTKNLAVHPKVSLLFIEDEHQSKNVFARKRIILKAQATFIDRKTSEWNDLVDLFEAKHGNTVGMLRNLSDFHLVMFEVSSDSYVQGFGQAFSFEGMDFSTIRQVTGR